MATIAKLLKENCDLNQREARWIIAHVLDCKPIHLLTAADQELNPDQEMAYQELHNRCQRGEPLAYLLGHWEFWSLDLIVNPAVLIPRPETELLVEMALSARPRNISQRVADLGTGSGAVALAIAHERPNWNIFATDCSAAAITIARQNAQRLGLKIEFAIGNWCMPLAGRRFDLIVSNPPYIPNHDPHFAQLSREPLLALCGGSDGLIYLRQIADEARLHLVAGGILILEHSATQGAALRQLLTQFNYQQIRTVLDLEGRERVTMAYYFSP